MKPRLLSKSAACGCLILLTWRAPLFADSPTWVELEVAAEQGGPPGNMQEWARLLTEIGVDQVRIRGANRTDQPHLEKRGSDASPRVSLVGVLTRRDVLVLPGGKFAQTDRRKLQDYLETIADQPAPGEERGRFNLTMGQFERLFALLTPAVGKSTKGLSSQAVVEQIASSLGVPLQIADDDRSALAHVGPTQAELESFSVGMALAFALRPAQRALAVERPAAGASFARLRVVPLDAERDTWPIGWKPDRINKVVAPQMYRVTTIGIKDYTLAQTITAMEMHMGVPLLFDERTLAELAIDPETIRVNVPRMKTFVKRGVDQALARAQLQGELRVDEAGRPFYWITQFGKLSPRAVADAAKVDP